jgi:hypothetical protein
MSVQAKRAEEVEQNSTQLKELAAAFASKVE